jgi:fumarylacetoacetase
VSGRVTRIEVPDGSGYGLDNLPYGVFSRQGVSPRVGVRLGDAVVDLAAVLDDEVFARPSLNAFMAQGRTRWESVRRELSGRLAGDLPGAAVHPVDDVTLHLPVDVADYVDFYASEQHATNLGRLFRPDSAPLTPNWRHVPLAYHGRAGTVVVSGTTVTRPSGQRKAPDDEAPTFGPSLRLDIEAELGFVVGVGSHLGEPIPAERFADHVFGAVLVNDWSARDLQAWEYVPLGPFLGKSFATAVSPWVVPMPALESAVVPRPAQDPRPLPYLFRERPWGLDVELRVEWNGQHVSSPPYRAMYWSPDQMLAHMTVNGARARTGDLYASGTVSGTEPGQWGSFIELSRGGREPLRVGATERCFVEDGDEVVITAAAPGRSGGRIGFGEVRTRVLPAVPAP